MNVLAPFGVDDGHDNLAEESQGDEPLLGLGEPVILVRRSHPRTPAQRQRNRIRAS